jgi:glycosyltransferase involved in cell wall biosynthesis
MILNSKNGKEYIHFNWKLYLKFYSELNKLGYKTQDELWWHFVNIGEQSGYIYFDISDYNTYLQRYNDFNCEKYITFIKEKDKIDLNNNGYKMKEEIWWHYVTTNNYNNFPTLTYELNTDIVPVPIITNSLKQTVYYFIHHTSSNSIRTGIQIVTIYLAKELLKLQIKYNFEIIFVKWDFDYNALVPCSQEDIQFLFHLDESDKLIEDISYPNSFPIHINKETIDNAIFFCPEIIFVINTKLPMFLKNYLKRYKLKSIYILYDIIPLVLPDYEFIKKSFNEYFTNNLLNANKIITISNFTKNEFIKYSTQNNLMNDFFPKIESIPLPYQYRDKPFSKHSISLNKITILLPGTVEPRKQQIVLMKMFNKFIEENPTIDVELIVFGQIINICINDFFTELNLSKGKIRYLGIITNNELFYLYSTATFSCYISRYEGYGFPISESLWHGTPVLTSNFGSMKEVASIGGCYCVDTNNNDEIYNALYNLIVNKEIIISLKNNIIPQKLTTWSSYSEEICKNMFDE